MTTPTDDRPAAPLAATLECFFATKTSCDVDGTMSYFAPGLVTTSPVRCAPRSGGVGGAGISTDRYRSPCRASWAAPVAGLRKQAAVVGGQKTRNSRSGSAIRMAPSVAPNEARSRLRGRFGELAN